MKTVSIRELHEHTGKLVREAERQPVVVTERGRLVAILRSLREGDLPSKPFPRRRLSSLPKVSIDSSTYVAADRTGR